VIGKGLPFASQGDVRLAPFWVRDAGHLVKRRLKDETGRGRNTLFRGGEQIALGVIGHRGDGTVGPGDRERIPLGGPAGSRSSGATDQWS